MFVNHFPFLSYVGIFEENAILGGVVMRFVDFEAPEITDTEVKQYTSKFIEESATQAINIKVVKEREL